MARFKEEIQYIFDSCKELYKKCGITAVNDYINEQQEKSDYLFNQIIYSYCPECVGITPILNNHCLICGDFQNNIQETENTNVQEKTNEFETKSINKQLLIDAVIKQIRIDMFYGDETVLEELLNNIPIELLLASLPEEQMKAMYEHFNKEMKQDTGLKDNDNNNIKEGDTL